MFHGKHSIQIEPAYPCRIMQNRSVPASIVLPHITYQNLPAAIQWLSSTFGFIEHYRHGEPISGAQLHLGNAWIMVHAAKPGYKTPAELGFGTQSLTIFIEEVEQHFARARAAGATIVEEPHETVYGEVQYAALDLEGHRWIFSRHARDVSPDTWGATIIHPIAK